MACWLHHPLQDLPLDVVGADDAIAVDVVGAAVAAAAAVAVGTAAAVDMAMGTGMGVATVVSAEHPLCMYSAYFSKKYMGPPKCQKYIENMVGLIIHKKSGTNFSNSRDP